MILGSVDTGVMILWHQSASNCVTNTIDYDLKPIRLM